MTPPDRPSKSWAWGAVRQLVPRWPWRWRPAALVLGVLGLCGACSRGPMSQSLSHGRFEQVRIEVPRGAKVLALVLAPSQETERARRRIQALMAAGIATASIDSDALVAALQKAGGCAFPAGDLDNLSRFLQAYLRWPAYRPSLLAGIGTGAQVVQGALEQAKSGTFAGGMVEGMVEAMAEGEVVPSSAPLSFCPAGTPAKGGQAQAHLWRIDAGPCVAPSCTSTEFEPALTALAAQADALAVQGPAGLEDLPVVEVPAALDGPAFAVFWSGDGGWAGIDQDVSGRLAAVGLPSVGVDSLRYFWSERTPERMAQDLTRLMRHYSAAWQRPRVVLIGFSQGADVLPFMLERLAPEERARVVATLALSPGQAASLEFHLSNWLGPSAGEPIFPVVQRSTLPHFVCVHGQGDKTSLCPLLDPQSFRVITLPGTHHFNGDYARLTSLLVGELRTVGALPGAAQVAPQP